MIESLCLTEKGQAVCRR